MELENETKFRHLFSLKKEKNIAELYFAFQSDSILSHLSVRTNAILANQGEGQGDSTPIKRGKS